MFDKVIYSVMWWTGTGTRVDTFLNTDNANAFAERVQKNGNFIAKGHMRNIPPAKYERLARKCIDYEPPKKR